MMAESWEIAAAGKKYEQELQREYMIAHNLAYGAKLIRRANRLRAHSFDLLSRSGELRTKPKTKAA